MAIMRSIDTLCHYPNSLLSPHVCTMVSDPARPVLKQLSFSMNTFTVFNKNTSYFLDDKETTGRLSHIHFSPTEVWASLSSLDCGKAHGIDNLNPKVLKHCSKCTYLP